MPRMKMPPRKIKKSRLSGKLLARILLFSSAITLIGTVFQLFIEYRADISNIQDQFHQVKSGHLESLTNSLWKLDDQQIKIHLNNIISLRDIVYIEILEEGHPIFSAGEKKPANPILSSLPMVHARQTGMELKIGDLVAYASPEGVHQRLLRRIFIIFCTQGMKTFLVSAFILFIIHHNVIRHLIRVSGFAGDFSFKNLDRQFEIDRPPRKKPDELDSLVDSLNKMRMRMKKDLKLIRNAETELKKNEQQLKAIFNTNPNPMVLYDSKGRLLNLNPAFTKVFGWTLKEMQGKKLPFVPGDQQALTNAKIMEIYQVGTPVTFMSKRLTQDGDIRDVMISGALIRGEGGEKTGMLVNLVDISEQRKMEIKLQQARKMESIGRLAGGIAHDFNNMLGVILGNTEILLEDMDPDQPLVSNVHEIRRAANRSADLTRQLLAFARRQTVSPRKLEINDTLENMQNMIKHLIGPAVNLIWRPGEGLWPVKMDPGQVEQVLANLCVNAKEAMKEGGKLVIETMNTRLDGNEINDQADIPPGEYVMVSVGDSGCGMNEKVLENLFEPFFTTKELGSGLGLAIVYGIIRQNNGGILVQSRPNAGTTINIYFPRFEEKIRSGEKPEDKKENTRNGNEVILLVEDEKAVLMLAESILTRLKYRVLSTTLPSEAIGMAEANAGRIDLLISDVMMPEMTGQEMAEKISAVQPGIKCLFMSGFTEEVIAENGVIPEKVNFIHKPFRIKVFAEKVREVLDSPDPDS